MWQRPLLGLAGGVVAASSYVASQWREFQQLVADGAVEDKLPLTPEAQATRVVRLRGLLDDDEVRSLIELRARWSGALGSAGRTAENQAAAYRTGSWETSYLSTDGHFRRELPAIREKLMLAAEEANRKEGWGLLERATSPVRPRCVELHSVERRGSLPWPWHHDAGSLITVDVMLSDPSSDFTGGELRTLEPDGTMREHEFGRGDALVFCSHKPHCVQPVSGGRRQTLIMELWEGEERECAHRCDRHFGPCAHSARSSFWRRVLSDVASDL